MNTNYTIKNFRVFDNDGVVLPIKPLTILTGCNSSGKSSIVKSMVLLDGYLNKLTESYNAFKKVNLNRYKLDFTTDVNSSLGNFKRAINRNSDSNVVELGYTVHSAFLGEDINVLFAFCPDENDDLNDGYFHRFTISDLNDNIIYSSGIDESNDVYDFNMIINNFYRYVIGEYLYSCANDYYVQTLLGKMSEKELSDYHSSILSYKDAYVTKYGQEIIVDIKNASDKRNRTYISQFANGNSEIVYNSEKNGTLFYMPILDKLFNVSKDAIRNVFKSLEGDFDAEFFNEFTSPLIDDFESSDACTFGEYFIVKQTEFLHNSPANMKLDGILMHNMRELYDDGGVSDVINNVKEINLNFIVGVLSHYENLKDNIYLSVESWLGQLNLNMFEMFKAYINEVITELQTNALPHDVSYISSSIVDIRRMYSLDVADSFSELLRKYFDAKRRFLKTKDSNDKFVPGSFINKWIKKFDIGSSIEIKADTEGLGVTIKLYSNEDDNQGSFLSEQGYGITQLFVILLRIETAIMESEVCHFPVDEYKYSLYDNSVLISGGKTLVKRVGYTIAIEEPEVHQHPKFQSLLADMFVDAYNQYNIHFIIETHSEYLIRKLQTHVAKGVINNDCISLIYMYNANVSKRPIYTEQVKTIEILPDGKLSDSFGDGFFDEADRLAMNLLNINVK